MPGEITTVRIDSSMSIPLLRERKDPAYQLNSQAQWMDLAPVVWTQLC